MGKDAKIAIRFMCEMDLPAILKIEESSYDYPWPETEFRSLRDMRHQYAQVAILDKEVVGYVISEVHPDHVYVHNLTVTSAARRQGIGTGLMNRVKERLTAVRRTRVEVHARETSLSAHFFLRANGFVATNVERGWYKDEQDEKEVAIEDAYRFVFQLGVPVKSKSTSSAA